jgi:hypothetical protein
MHKQYHACRYCFTVGPTTTRWILYPTCTQPFYSEPRCDKCLEDTFESKAEANAVLVAWKLTQ